MKINLTKKFILSGIMACLMIFVGVNSLFAASAVLSWNSSTINADGTPLNDLAGYKVYYGTGSGNYSGSIDVGNVVTYQVNNLSAGATYYFAATAYDATGNESQYSAEISKTLSVSDTTPPVISGVQTANVTDSSVTISWTTDEASDTKVQYGTTTSYGTTTVLNSSMVTSHSQNIGGLAASTLYHYRVISSDAAGNEAVSGDYTFMTSTLLAQETNTNINIGDNWKYLKGYSNPSPGWNTISFDASTWLEGPSGIGYGDKDDATILSDMRKKYISVYTRKSFNLMNSSLVAEVILSIDYDDGFVAYLNGQEVARANMPSGSPNYATQAYGREAGNAVTFDLSSYKNYLVTGMNVLAIEVHNASLRSSDLSLIPELTITTIPELTIAAIPDTSPVDYYCDNDNDGYTGTAVDGFCTGTGCEPAGCQITPGSDCNDGDAGISPDAADDTCDGIDDNCDGTPDNNYASTSTSCGEGVCSSIGQLICSSGSVVDTCTTGNPTGYDDDCNGIDDNCDGTPDNNYVLSVVSCGTGVCSSVGQLECQSGKEVNTCNPGIAAEDPETTCGDGLDNDCDGQVDEDCNPDIEVSTVLIGEDFSAGIPEDWSGEGAWNTDNECGRTIGEPFEGPYAIADSSCAVTGVEKLATQIFDTVSCETVTLDFSNQYYGYSGNVMVNLSSDGGGTWENRITVEADDGYPEPKWKEIDISSVAGSPEAQIKFRYANDTSDGFWALDNVWVTCQSDQVQFSAQVQDTILKTVMVTNRGEDDLVVDMINVEGVDASEFGIGDNEDCTNQALSPGESCTVDIIFAPLSSGAKSANIIISSNDPDTPALSLSLAGTGVADMVIVPVPVN